MEIDLDWKRLSVLLHEAWRVVDLEETLEDVQDEFARTHVKQLSQVLQGWLLDARDELVRNETAAQNAISLMGLILRVEPDQPLNSILSGFLYHPIDSVHIHAKTTLWRLDELAKCVSETNIRDRFRQTSVAYRRRLNLTDACRDKIKLGFRHYPDTSTAVTLAHLAPFSRWTNQNEVGD